MRPAGNGIEWQRFAAVTLPGNFNINSSRLLLKGAYALFSAMKNAEE